MIMRTKPLSYAQGIAAVPPRQGKVTDLPTQIAGQVAKILNVPLIEIGKWQNMKAQLKECPVNEKWGKLETAALSTAQKPYGTEKLILLDDLYQSGATLNFVGTRIKAAWGCEVYGVCVVKSGKDSDNQ